MYYYTTCSSRVGGRSGVCIYRSRPPRLVLLLRLLSSFVFLFLAFCFLFFSAWFFRSASSGHDHKLMCAHCKMRKGCAAFTQSQVVKGSLRRCMVCMRTLAAALQSRRTEIAPPANTADEQTHASPGEVKPALPTTCDDNELICARGELLRARAELPTPRSVGRRRGRASGRARRDKEQARAAAAVAPRAVSAAAAEAATASQAPARTVP